MMLYLHESDPVTLALIGTAVGGLASAGTAAYSMFGPKPSAPQMPTPAPPSQSPTGPGPSGSSGPAPSFLAAAAAPTAAQTSQKSLLGQ